MRAADNGISNPESASTQAADYGMPDPGSVQHMARQDFVKELYQACVDDKPLARAQFSSVHSTWFLTLQAAIRHSDPSQVSKEQWLGALATAILANDIEWVPGSHRSKLTHRRVVKLVGATRSIRVLAAAPGTIKRAAIDAASWTGHPKQKRRIDFGQTIPFAKVPDLITTGFEKLGKLFKKGNPKILGHYQAARNSLDRCLGDKLCDVMLIMVLTLASSSVTPYVPPQTRRFDKAPKHKDQALLAANLVTRMLWFLRPEDFPWDKDDGMVLSVSEMTQKIGKTLL